MPASFQLLLRIAVVLICAGVVHAQMPAVKVVVAQARTVQAPDTIKLVGTVAANRISRVGAEVEGRIDEMPVREGDRVEVDGVLCRLNDETLKWQLAEAKAKADALRSMYEELRAGTREEELDRLKAERDETVADRERWKLELDRVERLFEGSDSNAKELRDTHANYAMARGRAAAAAADYRKAVAGPRSFEIVRAGYDVAAQEAIVKRLERDLSKTIVRAPFTGHVTQRFVEVGEWVASGGQVVELAELDTVLVRVDAPESAYPYLVVGDAARVSIDALQRTFEGKVAHVIPKAERSARTVPVEITVDNSEGLLAAGMFARAVVRSGPRREVVGVPKDAVLQREGVVYVATVLPGRMGEPTGILLPVTVGAAADDWIAVTSGNVHPGMPIIVRGNERMMPFPSPIQVVDELGRPVEFAFDKKDVHPGAPTHHHGGGGGGDREGA